jgi:hypothetical protein
MPSWFFANLFGRFKLIDWYYFLLFSYGRVLYFLLERERDPIDWWWRFRRQ